MVSNATSETNNIANLQSHFFETHDVWNNERDVLANGKRSNSESRNYSEVEKVNVLKQELSSLSKIQSRMNEKRLAVHANHRT